MSDGDVYGEHIAMVIISGSANAAHLRESNCTFSKMDWGLGKRHCEIQTTHDPDD